jgi:endonuclease YncB( thermonuclease family)
VRLGHPRQFLTLLEGSDKSMTTLSVKLGALFLAGLLANSQQQQLTGYTPVKVLRVVDGSTAIVLINAKETAVRLIGLDSRIKAADAANCLNELIGGAQVFIEYEPDFAVGEGGPLPVYLYRETDKLFVNLEMARRGCCLADTDRPFKYAHEFRIADKEAEKAGRGLWASIEQQKQPSEEQKYHEPRSGDRVVIYDKGGAKVLALSDLDAIRTIVYADEHGYDTTPVYTKLKEQGRVSMVKSETEGTYEEARSLLVGTNTLRQLPCSRLEAGCMQWIKVQIGSGRSVWVKDSNLYIKRENIR